MNEGKELRNRLKGNILVELPEEKEYEIKLSTDIDVAWESSDGELVESRRYYIKTSDGYALYHHTLTEPGKYYFVIRTIDGELAERWLKGELVIFDTKRSDNG